jgi:HD-GYP domain-containing protein (c-di-GMP phosphodiesterase class II)
MSTASLQSLGYLPVATGALCPVSVLNCDLYIQRPGCPYAELYCGKTCPLDEEHINQLRQDGVDHLYIRLEDADAYRDYLCQHVLHAATVPQPLRLKALREVTRVAFEDALLANDCAKTVEVAKSFGQDLTGMLADQTPAFDELFKTLEHDFYTFTHVCNVSTYCTIIAIRMSACDSAELPDLAAGALLHDIGKRHIPAQILNKTGKLTDEEWELIREHPGSGFRELAARGDLSWGQLMMVYQHHERLDGSGYPAGVLGDEIHPWARICAVADVFDAMSCRRPYRKALPIVEVCDYLTKHPGLRFDAEVVDCWISHVRNNLYEPSNAS